MKLTVSWYSFRNAFYQANRRTRFPNTLYELFQYLEQFEDETGVELELDVVELCYQFEEATESEIRYNYQLPEDTDVKEWLEEHGAFIYADHNGQEEFFLYDCEAI